jgi:small subunit ribosomal protein S17
MASEQEGSERDVTQASERGRRKVRTGVVVSDAMDKTVLVKIDRQLRHPLYRKIVRRSSRLAAHDEANDAHVGDTVRVVETRPLSKTKRWRVVEIVERAK